MGKICNDIERKQIVMTCSCGAKETLQLPCEGWFLAARILNFRRLHDQHKEIPDWEEAEGETSEALAGSGSDWEAAPA